MKKIDQKTLEKFAKEKNIDKNKVEKIAEGYKNKSEDELIDELVKIGMNAVVNIITNEVNDVYAVPYEAIKNENGQSVVYAAKEKSGKYIVESIPVTTGLESDIYTEVSGTNLSDGLIILNDPSSYKVGDEVEIKLPQKSLQPNKERNSQDVTNMTEPKKDDKE